jgi:hypothetical protein
MMRVAPEWLSKEKREYDQYEDEESRERANPRQVLFDIAVIRIELGATRGRRHAYSGCHSFALLSHFKLLVL